MNTTGGNEAQLEIGRVAKAMLEGHIHYFAGAIKLVKLRAQAGIYENDPDFLPFIAIMQELDQLSIGRDPAQWAKNPGSLNSTTILESVDWAKDISSQQCASLIKRFRP